MAAAAKPTPTSSTTTPVSEALVEIDRYTDCRTLNARIKAELAKNPQCQFRLKCFIGDAQALHSGSLSFYESSGLASFGDMPLLELLAKYDPTHLRKVLGWLQSDAVVLPKKGEWIQALFNKWSSWSSAHKPLIFKALQSLSPTIVTTQKLPIKYSILFDDFAVPFDERCTLLYGVDPQWTAEGDEAAVICRHLLTHPQHLNELKPSTLVKLMALLTLTEAAGETILSQSALLPHVKAVFLGELLKQQTLSPAFIGRCRQIVEADCAVYFPAGSMVYHPSHPFFEASFRSNHKPYTDRLRSLALKYSDEDRQWGRAFLKRPAFLDLMKETLFLSDTALYCSVMEAYFYYRCRDLIIYDPSQGTTDWNLYIPGVHRLILGHLEDLKSATPRVRAAAESFFSECLVLEGQVLERVVKMQTSAQFIEFLRIVSKALAKSTGGWVRYNPVSSYGQVLSEHLFDPGQSLEDANILFRFTQEMKWTSWDWTGFFDRRKSVLTASDAFLSGFWRLHYEGVKNPTLAVDPRAVILTEEGGDAARRFFENYLEMTRLAYPMLYQRLMQHIAPPAGGFPTCRELNEIADTQGRLAVAAWGFLDDPHFEPHALRRDFYMSTDSAHASIFALALQSAPDRLPQLVRALNVFHERHPVDDEPCAELRKSLLKILGATPPQVRAIVVSEIKKFRVAWQQQLLADWGALGFVGATEELMHALFDEKSTFSSWDGRPVLGVSDQFLDALLLSNSLSPERKGKMILKLNLTKEQSESLLRAGYRDRYQMPAGEKLSQSHPAYLTRFAKDPLTALKQMRREENSVLSDFINVGVGVVLNAFVDQPMVVAECLSLHALGYQRRCHYGLWSRGLLECIQRFGDQAGPFLQEYLRPEREEHKSCLETFWRTVGSVKDFSTFFSIMRHLSHLPAGYVSQEAIRNTLKEKKSLFHQEAGFRALCVIHGVDPNLPIACPCSTQFGNVTQYFWGKDLNSYDIKLRLKHFMHFVAHVFREEEAGFSIPPPVPRVQALKKAIFTSAEEASGGYADQFRPLNAWYASASTQDRKIFKEYLQRIYFPTQYSSYRKFYDAYYEALAEVDREHSERPVLLTVIHDCLPPALRLRPLLSLSSVVAVAGGAVLQGPLRRRR